MKKCLLIPVFLLFFSATAWCQQDAQFSMYMFNSLYYNPAYAGVEGATRITAFHRSQWLGYEPTFNTGGGAPSTQVVSLSAPIYRIKSGFGVHIVNDNLGPQNNLEFQASYAYHLPIKNGKLSMGLRAGMYFQTIDFGKYDPIDQDDPVLLDGRESQARPDIAVGVWYQSQKFYAGASINHLLESSFDFGVDELRNALQQHLVFTAGYNYEVNFNFVLTPSILLKTDLNSYSFDINLLGTLREKYFGGLSFRQGDALTIMLGMDFLKDNRMRFGYAFDYVMVDQEAKQPTSHEFMLSYKLPITPPVDRKIIRTPRYRF